MISKVNPFFRIQVYKDAVVFDNASCFHEVGQLHYYFWVSVYMESITTLGKYMIIISEIMWLDFYVNMTTWQPGKKI